MDNYSDKVLVCCCPSFDNSSIHIWLTAPLLFQILKLSKSITSHACFTATSGYSFLSFIYVLCKYFCEMLITNIIKWKNVIYAFEYYMPQDLGVKMLMTIAQPRPNCISAWLGLVLVILLCYNTTTTSVYGKQHWQTISLTLN